MTFQVTEELLDRARYIIEGDRKDWLEWLADYEHWREERRGSRVKIVDPPPAPPKPVPPACGYWTSGDVMLHDPVWRKCNSEEDYWIHGSVFRPKTCGVGTYLGGYRWCLSVLTPLTVPACGYWERNGKRYKLADPMEYRLAKKGDVYFSSIDRCPLKSLGDHFPAEGPHWILREVPTVPACGYWEVAGKRYVLAEPMEYRLPKQGDKYFLDDHYVHVATARSDHVGGDDCKRWILREVPMVRRFTVAVVPDIYKSYQQIQVPFIDTGTGPRLDVDAIWRPKAIEWLDKQQGFNARRLMQQLRQEQEADNDR